MPTPPAAEIRRTRPATALIALLAARAPVLAACGGDGGESAQDVFCDPGDAIRESLDALLEIDLIAVGTSGVRDAYDAQNALSELEQSTRPSPIARSGGSQSN